MVNVWLGILVLGIVAILLCAIVVVFMAYYASYWTKKHPDLTKQTQEYTKAIADYNAIKDKFPAVQEEFENFKKEYAKLKEEYDFLNVQCTHLKDYMEAEEKLRVERAKHDN